MSRLSPILTMLIVISVVHAEIAHTPAIHRIRSWEPLGQTFGNCWQTILNQTTVADNDQGYGDAFRYKDSKEYDDDFELCARTFFEIINGGIFYINTHGTSYDDRRLCGWPTVVTTRTLKAANAWIAAGRGDVGFIVARRKDRNGFSVIASPLALEELLKPWHDRIRAIVIGQYCYSALTLGDIGGRVGFGYAEICIADQTRDDIDTLLRCMNGTLDQQEKRIAADAFAAGGYSDGFILVGNGATTLCPSVTNPCPDHARPWGAGAGQEGDGFIELDTAITRSFADPADQTLIYTVEKGELDISDIGFVRTEDGLINGIRFHYRADCIGDYKVVMRLIARRVVGDVNSELCLDGNDGTENQQQEGQADHGDDFVWSFED
jgi:hypothetical protein